MENCSRLILIGSTGRNSGKTYLAAELIRRFKDAPVTALKITCVERRNGPCPRGGEGCGGCAINSDFCLEEECSCGGTKDTALLRVAGAEKVFWLRCLRSSLARGFDAVLEHSGGAGPIICESNSLSEVVKPAFFIMIRDSSGEKPKPSAEKVMQKADITLQSPVSAENIEYLLKLLSKKGFNFE
ncbi:MAG: hypothetical protein LBC27_08380 [Spirochaetaceae bacterium]|jgi:hypothetical protein|nr:hypothetical protein [Spirochaetaceae bacterium]